MLLYPKDSYFTTQEFSCPCECGFGSTEHDIDENLIDLLNSIREMYGKPMVVTSGARCEDYNREVGGVEDSAHLPHDLTGQCRAVDILVKSSRDRYDLVRIALKLGMTRIGLARTFLHFDVAWDLPDEVIFNY